MMSYSIDSLESADNPIVLFKGIVGSRAYGTQNASSDTDVRGVFAVPSAEYARLVQPPKQVSDERNDRMYYSLVRFCELMSEANPTTMEMLFLPEDCMYDYGAPTGGIFHSGMLVETATTELDPAKRIGILIYNEQAFNSARRQHREYWDWRRNRNESRWAAQERGQMDYDAKNMMHPVRLLLSGENIVKTGEPIVRFFMKVRESVIIEES